MPDIKIEPELLAKVRNITCSPGWTAQPYRTMSHPAGIILKQGPVGRGQRKQTFLIVADTLGDAFRALGACLEALGQTEAF